MFHSFLSDDSKQDSTTTTTAHRKRLVEILKEHKVLMSTLGTIWGNTDGCAEQYRCVSTLYLMSVMSQFYSITIGKFIIAPGY